MKINISRQNIYLLSLSVFLLIFVFLFSFLVLIPEGKEYRKHRGELKQESRDLRKYQNFHDETLDHLKELQSDNKHIIIAFDNSFNREKFAKLYTNHFSSLEISQLLKINDNAQFNIYEVNTTSEINSPKSFYDFLEAVNKSDWIISVDFPINFKRDGELITSSFKMRVHTVNKDFNATKELNTTVD